ncbi:MMPL family transporter [Paenibacillus sp. 481]|uniref:MMPL family transporter n=1 Tax=Paenibacillus sp. 481 TaxID=2835869 RepID=UPI001E4733EA|nr:MMPL family transporter [Paenibacillus sp. 481]UHA72414.1 MMPL family transporter [Paenibacillus sp. 481]
MRESDKQGLFWHWGRFMFRQRHAVWIIWVILFVVMAFFAVKAPAMLKDTGFTPIGSESDKALVLMREELQLSSTTLDIVYESRDGSSLWTPEAIRRIEQSLDRLEQESYVTQISVRKEGHLRKRDDVIAATVFIDLDSNEAINRYPEIRKLIPEMDQVSTYVSGATAAFYDMQEASKRDIIKAEVIGLPIALIVLLLVFGTWLAGILPLIVGLMSVTITLGLIYFIALTTDSLSNFMPNIVSMLGLAVGIDYALFMVSRFREELRRQPSVELAVAMTAQRAGQSIFFSGVAVLIGLIAMVFIDLSLFHSICLGGVLVVTMSVIVGNTLLLAIFALLGERINRYKVIPKRFRRQEGPEQTERAFWGKVAYGVMKRPVTIVVVLSGLLIAFAWPISGMKIGVPQAEMLPPKYESRYGFDLLKQTYDMRELSPIQVVLRTDKPYTDEVTIEAVQRLTDRLSALEGVSRVDSYLGAMSKFPSSTAKAEALKQQTVRTALEDTRLVNNEWIVLQVISSLDSEGDVTFPLVREMREMDIDPAFKEQLVTGAAAVRLDIVDTITTALPYVIVFILIVTYIVLFIAFRSVLLPLKAVIMNVLSLGASLGIVVLVFQYGFLAELFQVTSTGVVVAMLPVIIFCVVFGISMDYEVFLLSRIAEQYDESGDNEQATAEGLKKTGSIITSAAFILIVVVGAFIFTDNEMMKAIGLGLATAVLLDATLIRLFLVPALMKLMGNANWWAPRWMRHKQQSKQ